MSESGSAERMQRLGAYAVVVAGRRLLLTRISATGFPAGSWALPGGRIEHGESPWTAVERELYEETGLRASGVDLWDVHSVHVVGDGRAGAVEDYHGVHILFRAGVEPGTPRVIETGGTTDAVAWVPWDEAAALPRLPVVDHVLTRLRG